MLTKEDCLQKYDDCKRSKNGGIPEYREFLTYAGINKQRLIRLFGSSAYAKLQDEAGDTPNKLQLERTPFETIMRTYGDLVTEVGVVPAYGEWAVRGLKPSDSGLRKKPHNMNWSDLPTRFVEWVKKDSIPGFDEALEIIEASSRAAASRPQNSGGDFSRLIDNVRSWTPARRRNSEGEYKIELRKHLESLHYPLNEEYGESQFDLLIEKKYVIELKKDPDLGEYDRLFGQLARHLQHSRHAIVLILEATRKDKYDNFTTLVDKYLNAGQNLVEVIKR
jgi:hypothetical protein